MKKILILFAAVMCFVGVPMAEAKKPMSEDVPQIGFNILYYKLIIFKKEWCLRVQHKLKTQEQSLITSLKTQGLM